MGGTVIYFCLFFYSYLASKTSFTLSLQVTLACLLPMMLTTVKEDLTHNVDIRIRFLALTLSSILLLALANIELPTVEHIALISNLFENPVFSFAFFALCLVSLANGCNFIDGMNGLLSFYFLGALMACLQLTLIVSDTFLAKPLVIYIIMILFFLLVNFPWGKLFLGDSGAYLIALLVGIWSINFFGTYKSISSWNAGLIFFYPIAEVTFSVLRKLMQHKSPFKPDRHHLHLKVFDIFNSALKKPRLANNLTTVFLAPFYLTPPFLLPLVYDSHLLIFIALTLLTFIYLILNIVIPAKTN